MGKRSMWNTCLAMVCSIVMALSFPGFLYAQENLKETEKEPAQTEQTNETDKEEPSALNKNTVQNTEDLKKNNPAEEETKTPPTDKAQEETTAGAKAPLPKETAANPEGTPPPSSPPPEQEKSEDSSEDGENRVLGYVEDDIDTTEITEFRGSNLAQCQDDSSSGICQLLNRIFPSKYVIPDATSVKNQGREGLCWAFSALAAAESGMVRDHMAGKEIDLSEAHLGYSTFHGQDDTFVPRPNRNWKSNGGNRNWATATLARWYGPVAEKDAKYEECTKMTEAQLEKYIQKNATQSRLKNAYWLPEYKGGDLRAIEITKACLQDEGAVSVAFLASRKYWNKEHSAYYCPEVKPGINHAVTIVGWDDQIQTGAPQNGAWIIKNSWGKDWGKNGYCYISYYDTSLCNPTFYEFEAPLGDRDRLYSYDGTGFGRVYKTLDDSLYGANVFTADHTQNIGRIGTYLPPDSTFTIRLYKNVKGADPRTGDCVYEQNGNSVYGGYYSVPLDKRLPVNKGEKFSVALQVRAVDGKYAYLEGETSYNRRTTAKAGQSFLSLDNGETWFDTATAWRTNICLKAIADQ